MAGVWGPEVAPEGPLALAERLPLLIPIPWAVQPRRDPSGHEVSVLAVPAARVSPEAKFFPSSPLLSCLLE